MMPRPRYRDGRTRGRIARVLPAQVGKVTSRQSSATQQGGEGGAQSVRAGAPRQRRFFRNGLVLGLVKTEDEALEVIVALVQMYREQARYLERIYKWAKRVGVAEIRRQVLDDCERRMAFFDRFVFSQKFAQVDPWSERVSGLHKHEFLPIAAVGMAQAAE